MPGDDPIVSIDQDRVGESELLDAGCDLADLRRVVRPAVARVWNQIAGRQVFNL